MVETQLEKRRVGRPKVSDPASRRVAGYLKGVDAISLRLLVEETGLTESTIVRIAVERLLKSGALKDALG